MLTKLSSATRTKLSDNAQETDRELITALYNQHPFVSPFQVSLEVKKRDDSRGYAYGQFILKAPGDNTNRFVKVPFTVVNQVLSPLDVMLLPPPSNAPTPFTEQRVNVFFSSDMSIGSLVNRPKGMSIMGDQDSGNGPPDSRVGHMNNSRFMKMSSLRVSKAVVEQLLNTEIEANNDKIMSAISEIVSCLEKKAQAQPIALCKVASGGFSLTYDDGTEQLLLGNNLSFFDRDAKQKATEDGIVLLGGEDCELVKESSLAVGTDTNVIGFTSLHEPFLNKDVNVNFVADPSGAYVIDEFVSVPVQSKVDLSDFTFKELIKTAGVVLPIISEVGPIYPFDIVGTGSDPEGNFALAKTPTGNSFTIREWDGPYTMSKESSVMLVPRGSKCISLTKQAASIKVVHDERLLTAVRRGDHVELITKQGSILLKSSKDTLLAFGQLGFSDIAAKEKIAAIKRKGSIAFIPPAANKKLVKEASANINAVDINMVKLAFDLSGSLSQESVDSVLGLSFVTPENMALFVNNLPSLEKTLSELCSLLIAVRLGLSSVAESAVSTAVRAIDRIVIGLKALAIKVEATSIQA